MIKGIVFDFDGVILESTKIKTEAFTTLFSEHPDHLDKIVKLHLDNAGISRFEKFKIIYRDYIGYEIKEDELDQLGNLFSNIIYDKILCCPFVPGAQEFLEKYYGKYHYYIASGVPEYELRDIINQRHIAKYFRGVYGSPETKTHMLLKIISNNHYKSGEVIFIGDSEADYVGAIEASVPFIGRVPKGFENPFPDNEDIIMIVEDMWQLDKGLSHLDEKMASANRGVLNSPSL
jgi:phosphoglycolate phosphatase